jgi:hypothetical protein
MLNPNFIQGNANAKNEMAAEMSFITYDTILQLQSELRDMMNAYDSNCCDQ